MHSLINEQVSSRDKISCPCFCFGRNMRSLKIYEIDSRYVKYLSAYQEHIFFSERDKSSRKYIGIVLEINGFKYELEDNFVDIIEIDGASNRGIDNIRELREKVDKLTDELEHVKKCACYCIDCPNRVSVLDKPASKRNVWRKESDSWGKG